MSSTKSKKSSKSDEKVEEDAKRINYEVKLIEFVEQHSDLWNTESENYKNRSNIHVWNEFSNKHNENVSTTKANWNKLRSAYNRNNVRITKAMSTTGQDGQPVKKKVHVWHHQQRMSFLSSAAKKVSSPLAPKGKQS